MLSNFTYRFARLLLVCSFTSFLVLITVESTAQNPPVNGGYWEIFPQNLQLYPRNVLTGIAQVRVKGYYTAELVASGRLLVSKDANNDGNYDNDNGPGDQQYYNLVMNAGAGDPKNFDINVPITAGLFSYRFRLLNGFDWVVNRTNIVAGDAYYIQGQSNAEAKPVFGGGDENKANNDAGVYRNFVRVFGGGVSQMPQWYIGDGNKNYNQEGNLGQFGMRIGALIVQNQGIPVAIMNGAELGHPISYFQKDAPEDPNQFLPDGTTPNPNYLNNYKRELNRLLGAGLNNHIRAVIWFQGESNTYNGSDGELLNTGEYIQEFNKLYDSWRDDLGLAEKFYIYQIKPGCSFNSTAVSCLPIQEAQRLLDLGNPRMEIISTNNLPKFPVDDCHYRYETGYKEIGNRTYTLIARDFYGATPGPNMLTPVALNARFSAIGSDLKPNKVRITVNIPTDDLVVSGNMISLFKLNGPPGTVYTVTSVDIVPAAMPVGAKEIEVSFTRSGTANPASISLLSAEDYMATPSIANNGGTGLGLINFSNMAIDLGVLPIDPLNLRVSNNGTSNTLNWDAQNNSDFDRFEVEKSEDGNLYASVATIAASAVTTTAHYSYTDIKPNAVRTYYRIKGIRQNDKIVYSQAVAVNNRANGLPGLTIYPNPVKDRANISLSLKKAGTATVQVFDGSGRMVSSRKISLQKGSNMFSAGEILDQSAGIYMIRVVTDDTVYTGRVVRVK